MDVDPWNSRFANEHSALVVSLDYAKAPANPFPGQTADIVALFDAVLSDAELLPHIDPSRVGMMGFSAGGNLALTVAATPAVCGRLTAGLVPVYPIVDFSIPRPEKAKTRRYKPALAGARGATEDSLNGIAPAFGWAYLPGGQDLRDPRLSPSFNERKDFPRRIWFVGCELDVLGHETWRMACRFAGKREPGMDEPIGQQDLADEGARGAMIVEGNERFAWEVADEEGEIKWLCVADAAHGFDSAEMMGADEETVQDGLMKRDKLITMTGKWLFG
uniref:Alpha/beta hydrolase fold-3 domain-containing protein n=1 Tax=Mycena chlorophos TaxID=658473 RepID=A0ABQ0LP71_MYCCL|nr:predicted protein [Mycena chlorophos]